MTRTLAEMTAEIRANNIEKGWRPAEGGPGTNTFGDYLALLHSEVSEALEAYRDHRLEDATNWQESILHDGIDLSTGQPPKPEGVGSELADVLIRLLDMADVFGIEIREMDAADNDAQGMESFGDHLAWLHYLIANLPDPEAYDVPGTSEFSETLQAIYVVAMRYGIDLDAEYERKMRYNRTRPFRHGGRAL
jgi:NTP pyrophosphatase (non-canonical NTP hydrolase)